MKPKPDGCRECPMYQDGLGFVKDFINKDSILLIVGQNPGREEEQVGIPFVGETGKLLVNKYLPLTGIHPDNASYANTIRCRWRNSNDLPPRSVLNGAINACRKYDPNLDQFKLIVAQGVLAWEVLSNRKGSIKDWRGYIHDPRTT